MSDSVYPAPAASGRLPWNGEEMERGFEIGGPYGYCL